jgi:hypothetical protein
VAAPHRIPVDCCGSTYQHQNIMTLVAGCYAAAVPIRQHQLQAAECSCSRQRHSARARLIGNRDAGRMPLSSCLSQMASSSCCMPCACAWHPQATQLLPLTGFFLVVTRGGGILLAGHTRFSWANPTARGRRLCLTNKTRHTPNTRGCPAPGPQTAEELNPYTPLVCYS